MTRCKFQEHLVKYLRSKRKEMHLTQNGLAEKLQLFGLDISRDRIEHIERDLYNIRVYEMIGICQVLEIPLSDIQTLFEDYQKKLYTL